MRFGIAADDHTGATDAAGMLTERGVRTVLFLSAPACHELERLSEDYDAVVIGTRSRGMAPRDAYDETAAAVRALADRRLAKIQIKYCSTFDSTAQGNIGASLDAAMDVLGARATIVTPALPVNGRTTYCGYHFVDGRLLSESHMRNHPLTPMTDAFLVRWLQHQTRRRVSLIHHRTVREGDAAVRQALHDGVERGKSYFVTDAVCQADLGVLARATADWPLISGGSGITAEVPGLMFGSRPALSFAARLSEMPEPTLIVAGSCSPATREQNDHAARSGFTAANVDGAAVLTSTIDVVGVAARVREGLSGAGGVVLRASADPAEVERVQRLGAERGLAATEVGAMVASVLAGIAAQVVASGHVGRLIVSGGETAGAVCRQLAIRAVEVGLPVAPGVPYCFPIPGPQILLVLKSGNFGGDDFYSRVRSLRASG